MTIRVLLLDRNKVHINFLIQSYDHQQFSFIRHQSNDVVDSEGHPVGFIYHNETLKYLDRIMSETPFDFIIACSESQIQFAGLLRMRYGLTNGPDVLLSANVTNKLSMRKRLADYVLSPRFWNSGEFLHAACANSAENSLPAKVVVKPLYGSSSQDIQCLTLPQALKYLVNASSLFIVEEYIPLERELHCDGVVIDGNLSFFLLSRYARPWLGGNIQSNASLHLPNSDRQYKASNELVKKVLKALGIQNGVFHIELFDYQDQLYFGEIGLRPGGGGIADSIKYFYDVDIWDCYFKLALGINPRLPPQRAITSTCGYIGLSLSDLNYYEELMRNPMFSHTITLNPRTVAQVTGCLAYKELLFFSCETEEDAMSEFSKLING
jgi:biotin carboxylase